MGIFNKLLGPPDKERAKEGRELKELIKALQNKRSDVQVNAIRNLGKIGNARAVKPLFNCVGPKYESVEERERIYKKGSKYWLEAFNTIFPTIVEALINIGEPAAEELIRVVKKGLFWQQLVAVWALCEIGYRKATEPVLDWIFEWGACFPLGSGMGPGKEYYTSTMAIELLFPPTTLPKLLGDYAELVLGVFRVRPAKKLDLYDLSECHEAVQRLCMISTPISSNILRKVTKIENFVLAWKSQAGGFTETKYVDATSLRQMAKEELKRRGKPRYNPSAYLEQDTRRL